MGETIHVHFGTYYWQNIIDEANFTQNTSKAFQGINQPQNHRKYFETTKSDEKFPRSIFVDLDSKGMQLPQQSSLFDFSSFISNDIGGVCSWANGFYTEGPELMEFVMEKTRLKAEKCDCLKNFNVFAGLGGGTGSGMSSLFALKAKEEYPKQFLTSFSVLPSIKITYNGLEHYNFGFASQYLNESCDACVLMDNEALIELCLNELGINKPLFSDLNYIIGLAMSNITFCDRSKDTEFIDFTKLAVNLIPLPTTKLLTVGLSPILSKTCNRVSGHSYSLIIHELLSLKNMFCFSNRIKTKILAAAGIFRGIPSSYNITEMFNQIVAKNKEIYVDWIPNNTKNLIFSGQPIDTKVSGTLICNSSAILEPYRRFYKKFYQSYVSRASLKYFLHEGMDDLEFEEAYFILKDVIDAYKTSII